MGLCHEFGSQIRAGCDHPMRAGASACSCAECGVVCRGLFDGCPDVWARGPRPVAISATRAAAANGAPSALTPASGLRPETVRVARPAAPPAAIGPGAVDDGDGVRDRDRDRADDWRDTDDKRRTATDAPPAPTAAASDDRAAGPAESAGSIGTGASDAGRESAGDPRREVFRWFEEAFEGVRGELQALIGSMTHQQAMLAELLDSRQAELRLALVAESLPDIVADAVSSAMDEHTTAMAHSFERVHERFRDDSDQIRADTASTVESLNQAFAKLTGVIAVHDEEAEQREAVRLGALKGSVTRQITPLADALAALGDRIDAIAEQIEESSRPAPVIKVPAARTPAAKSPAARTPAAKSPLVKPASGRTPSARTLAPRTAAAVDRAEADFTLAVSTPVAARSPAPAGAAMRVGKPAAGKLVSTARMGRAEELAEEVAEDPPAPPARRAAISRATPPADAGDTTSTLVGRRAATARVSAGRASEADPSDAGEAGRDPEPRVETARQPRVITRRAKVPAPVLRDEPVGVYELETEAGDGEADWTPPAWVSAPSWRPGPKPAPAPAARSGVAQVAPKARIIRSPRTP